MQKSLLHILPFETLIRSLKNQGFSIGVDSHLRVRALLEDGKGQDQDLEELKVQMGVILARDEEEQAHFYRVFDSYVEKYSFDPAKKITIRKKTWWSTYGLGLLFSLLALLFVALLAFSWWQNNKGPKAQFAWAQQAGRQILWLEDVSTTNTLGGIVEDSILSRTWFLENGEGKAIPLNATNDKMLSHLLDKPGNYAIMLVVESRYGKDTLKDNLDIVPAYSVRINSSKIPDKQDNKTRMFRAQRFSFPGDSSHISPAITEALEGTWNPQWETSFSWEFE